MTSRHVFCPWPKTSLLFNDRKKSINSEWLFGAKGGPGPIPRGFLLLANKAWAISPCLTEGTRVASLETGPISPPGRCTFPKGFRTRWAHPWMPLPSAQHGTHTQCWRGRIPKGREWPGPGRGPCGQSCTVFSIISRCWGEERHQKQGWNSTCLKEKSHLRGAQDTSPFLKTEGPSQLALCCRGGFQHNVMSQCALSPWRGFRRPLKSSALNPC